DNCVCFQGLSPAFSPEAARRATYTGSITQGTWSRALSNRLLLEAGLSVYRVISGSGYSLPSITPETISVTEQSIGLQYHSLAVGCCGGVNYGDRRGSPTDIRFSVAYVTGSHAFKAGLFMEYGKDTVGGNVGASFFVNQALSYTFNFGVPTSLTQ